VASALREQRDENNVHELHQGEVAYEWPLIPAGSYNAVMVRYQGCIMPSWKNTPKVYVHFKIVDPGEHFGKVLYRAYNVRRLRGKAGTVGQPIPNCGFVVGRRSDLLKMLVRVLDVRIRPDRVSLHSLKGCVLQINVRTVLIGTDDKGKQSFLPEALRYSVVDDVVRKVTG
jgi:hypothetical protein